MESMKIALPPLLSTVLASVAAAAMAGLTAYSVAALGYFDRTNPTALIACTIALWVIFALAILAIRSVPTRPAIAISWPKRCLLAR